MPACGLAALWSLSAANGEQERLLGVKARAETHPEGRSFRVTSEAAAALFALLQLEDVSGHKG